MHSAKKEKQRYNIDVLLQKAMERTIKQAVTVKLSQEEDLIVDRILKRLNLQESRHDSYKVHLPGLEVNQGGGI